MDGFGSNREAVERAFDVLGSDVLAGHAIPLVEAVRRLADLVDAGADEKTWREYRFFLKDLREVTADGGASDLDVLIDSLRASVGDGENPDP